MANKRMFSKKITSSDAFMDMPQSTQLLYFHMCLEADDDGFVSNPKKIIRMIGSNDDDLKILLSKRFLLAFESGVVVIKHWLLHNAVRKDMYQETQYLEEKKGLQIKNNFVYTEARNDSVTPPCHRIDKNRIDKIRIEDTTEAKAPDPDDSQIPLLMKEFESINPSIKRMYGNKTQRAAAFFLLKTYGLERLKVIVGQTLPKTNTMQYFPAITTPVQLQDKFAALEAAINKHQSGEKKSKGEVAF